jgi:SAM-dependent methyltransferase
MRLNLGSGPQATPGWINIDRSPNVVLDRAPYLKSVLHKTGIINAGHMAPWDRSVIRGDIRVLPYANDSIDAIYSSHTLEHLFLDDATRVIRECARVLRPGAILRLALPNGLDIARRLLEQSESGDLEAGWKYHQALLAHSSTPPRGLDRVRHLAGGHIHRWQPVPSMVITMMSEAGFFDIEECAFQKGKLADLAAVETREQSFFLEGAAPG